MAAEQAALPAIAFTELTKVYRLYARPRDRIVEALTGRFRHTAVHALRGVTATIPRGTVVGIVGENGSGKSTLLKILAGTTAPTSGTSAIEGRVAAILELGSSFHAEVTGRRNAVLQAALAGLTKTEIAAALPEIEAFAEIGDFFDRPVRTYSSGMTMRLAFAVATAIVPDTLILDEALAVGDSRFQKKCIDRIHELRAGGRTIFFCSHALYHVSTFCDRALWLRGGEIAAEGDAQEVVLAYEEYLAAKDRPAGPAATTAPSEGLGRFISTRLLGPDGEPTSTFRPGEPWRLEVVFEGDTPERELHVHVAVVTSDQVTCFVADSRVSGAGPFRGAARHTVDISVEALPLAKGEFIVVAFLGDERGLALFDSRSDLRFRVETSLWTAGLMSVPARWEVRR